MWVWAIAIATASELALSVDRWTSRDGLPQNSVTDIHQDRHGYVWITTFGGIARFDGLRFEVFDPATVEGLNASRFLSIAEGDDDVLWFGSESEGLFRYEDGGFFQIPGTPVGVIHDLHVDVNGLVWIAADKGVFVWDGAVLAPLSDVRSFRIAADEDRVLVSQQASEGAKLRCMKGDCTGLTGHSMAFPALVDGELIGLVGDTFVREDLPQSVRRESGQPWWFGAPALRWQDGVWVHDGAALVGWTDGGVARHELAENVRAMMVDREQGLWLGTHGEGLVRVRRRGVTVVDDQVHELGFAPGGVYGWACGRGQTVAGRSYPTLIDDGMCGVGAWAGPDKLWFVGGIHDRGGLYSRTEAQGWTLHVPGAGSIVDDRWAFMNNAVYRLDGDIPTLAARGVDFGVAGRLTALRADENGGVWGRSAGGRVFHLDAELNIEMFEAPPVRASVRDVLPVDGGLWVGTYGGGLHFMGDARRRLDRSTGLCDNSVSHFDVHGEHLWMNTNRGYARVSLAELARVQRGEQDTIQCELVESGEGNGSTGTWFEGRLYVPTIRGIVAVDPDTALPAPVAPKVALDNVTCGRTAIRSGDRLSGPCDLSFEAVGLSFEDPLGLQFRHRLRATDPWSGLSPRRRIGLVDLEPGRYDLQVQAQSARGVWSEVVRLPFVRQPLWWETPIARFVLPALVGAALLGLLLMWVRRTLWQNRDLRREVEQRLRVERELVAQQAEKEQALEQLAEARRLEAIGRLAAGVGHDFNNLLMIVLGRMETIRTHEEVREDADVVVAAAQRAAGLTSQLLTFGRQSISHSEHLDVSACVEGLRPVLERLCGEATLHITCEGAVWVQVDKTRLEQLLSNLVVNAGDAHASTIHVSVATDGPAWMTLEVRDDGDGMPDDVVQRIFEPYFTTKREGRGTGLGMATVHGVAEEAGGNVRVASKEGEGTTVTARLPRFALRPRVKPVRSPALTLEGVHVLVVDDDAAVLETVAGQLRAYKADVEVCADSRLAPDLVAIRPPDVLISDVMMPGLNGPELERTLRAAGADMPILFMSGFLPSEAGIDPTRVLRKPFAARSLATRVRRLVRTPDSTGH